MFVFIKKFFIGLLNGLVNAPIHTRCVSLSNQKSTIQPTVINLHPNEYSQGLYYYPIVVNLVRCFGSCNNLIDFSNKVCLPTKILYRF